MRGAYEHKRAQTRRRLVRAGMACFAERGAGATTVGEVAARAEVVPGTFYNYFPTKEALVAEVVDQLVGGMERSAQQIRAVAGDPADRLALAVVDLVESAGRDELFGRTFVEFARTDPELRRRVRAVIDGGIDDGARSARFALAPSVTVTDAVLGTVLEAMRSRLRGRAGEGSGEATAALLLHLLGTTDAAEVAAQADRHWSRSAESPSPGDTVTGRSGRVPTVPTVVTAPTVPTVVDSSPAQPSPTR